MLCSFVSSTAPEVATLADKYAKMKRKTESKGKKVHVSCDTKSLSILHSEALLLDKNFISENDDLSEI